MYKLNFDSQRFTDLLKAHTFTEDFILRDFPEKGVSEPVKLELHFSVLQILNERGYQIKVIPINKYFSIKTEDLSSHDLKISFKSPEEIFEFHLIANSLTIFTEWKQALSVSRRPEIKDSQNCSDCSLKFYIFRKKIHCKYCGNCYCSNCCIYRAHLEGFAYLKKQEICKKCVQDLKIPGYGPQNSMVMKRKVIETRSVLE